MIDYPQCNPHFPYDTEHPKTEPDPVVIMNTHMALRAEHSGSQRFVTDM